MNSLRQHATLTVYVNLYVFKTNVYIYIYIYIHTHIPQHRKINILYIELNVETA